MKSLSVPLVATVSDTFTGPATVRSFSSGGAAVDEHIGPRRGEALVLGHVVAVHSARDVADVRNRLARIAHVLVEALLRRRAGSRAAPPAREIQLLRLRVRRRPRG